MGPALLLVPWLRLLDTEDDALGDLGHLPLAVLDRQFGAETPARQMSIDRMDVLVPPESYIADSKACVVRLKRKEKGLSECCVVYKVQARNVLNWWAGSIDIDLPADLA